MTDLTVWLGTSIIYVYGKVNDVETTFTLLGGGLWQATVSCVGGQ